MNDYNISVNLLSDRGIEVLTFVVAYASNVVDATKRAVDMVLKSQNCSESDIVSINVELKN